MSKERRTVTLDEEVDEYLGSEGVNASELVNRLVKSHLSSGGGKRAMLELRAEQLESELSELNGRVDTKESELAQVRGRLGDVRDERQDVVDEAREKLSNTPLKPENPAVRRWAEKAGMDVEAFIREISEGDS